MQCFRRGVRDSRASARRRGAFIGAGDVLSGGCGIEARFDGADVGLDFLRRGIERGLEFGCRGLHLRLHLLQFLELELAVDVRLHVGDVALQPAEQMAERARGLRQLLGTEHDQRDDRDDHDLA